MQILRENMFPVCVLMTTLQILVLEIAENIAGMTVIVWAMLMIPLDLDAIFGKENCSLYKITVGAHLVNMFYLQSQKVRNNATLHGTAIVSFKSIMFVYSFNCLKKAQ